MTATIAERKADKVARLQTASAEAMRRLESYAAEHAGRFLVFGSAARGDLRIDSDFDVIVDFPAERERAALKFAEDVSFELGLRPDARLIGDAAEPLLVRVRRDAVVLQ